MKCSCLNSATKNWIIRPKAGFIKKLEHQILIVKLKPRKDGIQVEKCELALNYRHQQNASANSSKANMLLELPIVGAAASPELGLENDGVVYFAPTCKSSTSNKAYEIVNMTGSRVYYEWKIPYEAKELFAVDQVRSYLEPFQKKVDKSHFRTRIFDLI